MERRQDEPDALWTDQGYQEATRELGLFQHEAVTWQDRPYARTLHRVYVAIAGVVKAQVDREKGDGTTDARPRWIRELREALQAFSAQAHDTLHRLPRPRDE